MITSWIVNYSIFTLLSEANAVVVLDAVFHYAFNFGFFNNPLVFVDKKWIKGVVAAKHCLPLNR